MLIRYKIECVSISRGGCGCGCVGWGGGSPAGELLPTVAQKYKPFYAGGFHFYGHITYSTVLGISMLRKINLGGEEKFGYHRREIRQRRREIRQCRREIIAENRNVAIA